MSENVINDLTPPNGYASLECKIDRHSPPQLRLGQVVGRSRGRCLRHTGLTVFQRTWARSERSSLAVGAYQVQILNRGSSGASSTTVTLNVT